MTARKSFVCLVAAGGTPAAKATENLPYRDDVAAFASGVNSGVESCKSFRFGVDGEGYPPMPKPSVNAQRRHNGKAAG